MATEVGKGYVDIKPDASGFEGELDKQVTSKSGSITGTFAKLGKTAFEAMKNPIAIGAALFAGAAAIGSKFDESFDQIRITTGKTGDALAGLQDDFKSVVSSVPTSFGDASTAVADLNQQLGLSGQSLRDRSEQFINLSRITGTDLSANIKSATGLFNQWGVSVDDQGGKLDALFRITQQTGVTFDQLSSSLAQGGAQFRSAGLTFEESAALVGLLAKNGLAAGDVIPALGKAMAVAAKDGKSASDVFQTTFDRIRDAPNDTAAASAALEVFGAKAGPKFAELIRTGQLSYEEFAASIAAGGDTINQAAADTDDWQQKLQLLGNKALVALEPLATKAFDAIGKGIDIATPYVERFTLWLGENLPKAFSWLQTNVLPIVEKVFGAVIQWDKFLLDTFKEHWPTIRAAIGNVVAWLRDTAWPVIERVFASIRDAVQTAVVWVIENWPKMRAAIAATVNWITGTAVPAVVTAFEAVKGAVQTVVQFVQTWWPKVAAAVKLVVDWISTKFGELVAIVQKHWGEISQSVSDAWVIIQQVVKAAAAVVYVSVMAFITAVKFIWDNFGQYIVAAISNAWEFIKAIFSAAIEVITGVLAFFKDLFTGNWGALWGDVVRIFTGVWDGIKAYLQLAVDTLILILQVAWDAIKIAVQAAWDAVALVISTVWDGIKSGVQSVVDAIKDLLSTTWDAIKTLASSTWDAIKTAITTPITAAKDLISGVWTDIKSAASTAWDGIKTAADTAWNAVKDTVVAPISAAKTAISNVWDAIVGQVGGLPSRIANVAIGMWDGIKNAFKTAINWIIDKWNALGFHIKLPTIEIYNPFGDNWKLGGNSWDWEVWQIPRLATGAVVANPTLAVVGDAGPGNPEIVAPRDMLFDTMIDAIRSVQSMQVAAAPAAFPDEVTFIIEGQPFRAILADHDRQLAGAIQAGRR